MLERENAEPREKLIFPKKRRLPRVRDSMALATYELIDAKKARHSIVKMCAWLDVSRSGYYEWRERPASATARRRTLLTASVAETFAGAERPGIKLVGDITYVRTDETGPAESSANTHKRLALHGLNFRQAQDHHGWLSLQKPCAGRHL
ncbi:hypothetical protein GCM10020220_083360 [Nonomuraea rubra]